MTNRNIKRALISVYDKTGIVDFARALVGEFGIEIISTGGTAELLRKSGIPVTLVEQVTGFPEMLDGRVKTLHPKIHAAILADRDNPEHMRQLAAQGIEPIDMVVVNLYPFEKTVAEPGCTFGQAIEMIDIGGPCLLRAAAKNHKHVLVVTEDQDELDFEVLYEKVLYYIRDYDRSIPGDDLHPRFARAAFWATSSYDDQVHEWLQQQCIVTHRHRLVYAKRDKLRYGENPHQTAELVSLLTDRPDDLTVADKGLGENPDCSYNNLLDADAALGVCQELTRAGALLCGTGFQPVTERQAEYAKSVRVTEERHTRRNLPHFQTPGRAYFVTFRLRENRQLSPAERDIVLGACLYWHQRRMDLHAAVVMPDHVHLLMTPREIGQGEWASLGELLHSIKRHSAREVNKVRGTRGSLWQDESFDRIMRDQKEFDETFGYIGNNPITAGIADQAGYPWFWEETMGMHRLQTGATPAEPEEAQAETAGYEPHRLQTGATLAACAFVKHTNPCGVGIAGDRVEAYRRAYFGDPHAAMGGILACNWEIDSEFATVVMETYDRWGKTAGAGAFFVEVWIAPAFAPSAVKLIREAKKWGERVRLLEVGDMNECPDAEELEYRTVAGGMLIQTRDLCALNEDQWKVVTKRVPSESEMADLRLAWLIAKHTKSNAISVCKDGMLIGNGAGQMSRVMSCRIATWLARENGHAERLAGAAAASDAFFPFADGPAILLDAGVTALIQPGGSKRDEETIRLCDERGAAMIFTGTRHFKH